MTLNHVKVLAYSAILTVCLATAVNCKSFEVQPRIIGGQNVNSTNGQYPYMVAFFDEDNFINSAICGGAIISHFHVLSSARIVKDFVDKPDRIKALVGTKTLDEGIFVEFDRVVIHPSFDERFSKNDISILRTTHEIMFVENVIAPIALPTKETKGDLNAVVTGWGLSNVRN